MASLADKSYFVNKNKLVRRAYHSRLSCVVGRHPPTDSSLLTIPKSLVRKLTKSHLAHVLEQFRMTPTQLAKQTTE